MESKAIQWSEMYLNNGRINNPPHHSRRLRRRTLTFHKWSALLRDAERELVDEIRGLGTETIVAEDYCLKMRKVPYLNQRHRPMACRALANVALRWLNASQSAMIYVSYL